MIFIVKNGEFESVRSRKVVKQTKNLESNQRKFLGGNCKLNNDQENSLERKP